VGGASLSSEKWVGGKIRDKQLSGIGWLSWSQVEIGSSCNNPDGSAEQRSIMKG
jgi:hypothetical protein